MKKIRIVQISLLAVLVCLVFAAGQARADVFMKQKTHTDAFQMMGKSQPAKDEIMTFWLGENKVRTDMEGAKTSSILLSDKKILYMIDHNKMQYAEMSLDFDKMIERRGRRPGRGRPGQRPRPWRRCPAS